MVELRSRTYLHSQLHSIRAIKDGSIKIVTNVVAKGKSKLKFRQLVDVYSRENIKDDESIPIVVRDLDNVSDMTQGSCLFGSDMNIKTEPGDFNMTLQKIRKQCKEKKRKLRDCRDVEPASNVEVKQENLTIQSEDEGCVIEEPLSSWITKFSKRRKKKQEPKTKCVPPSTKKVDLPVFHDVKPEAWDDSYSISEAMDFVSTDPLLDRNKESESTTNTELVEEIVHDSSKDTRLVKEIVHDSSKDTRLVKEIMLDYCSQEPNPLGMVAIEDPMTTKPVDKAFKEASEDFYDARKERCCLAADISLVKQEHVLYGIVSREETELGVPQKSESEIIGCLMDPISSNTGSGCEEVKEDEESNDSNLEMTITGMENLKIEAPEILANVDMTITGLETVKIEVPEKLRTDYSGFLTMNLGVDDTEIVWENEDIDKDELPEATDILQIGSCCNSLDNLHSALDDSTNSLEDHLPERLQQSSSSGNVDEAGEHKSSQLFQAPDEAKTADETDSIQQQELHSQPEKLLSGRKALSPTSQAKLRKAMEHPDSPEKKCKKSKGKLYFSSQNSHRILKAQGLESIDRVEVIPNSKQATRKAKNNIRQTQYQRGTYKFPRRDSQATKPQPFSTGCTSLQGCTQKAIAFSQGQMRDFQYVAAKLTKELKSMRQFTKRCLVAESNPSVMPECSLDEVKRLIGNAERTEESSKKWLSMIERDCSRFCKLMGMVREDSPATENILQKKKKIRFADDAGGDLCHVKVFDLDLEPES